MPLKVNLAHHPLDAFGGVVDLAHVLPQDPVGYLLRQGGAGSRGEGSASDETQLSERNRMANARGTRRARVAIAGGSLGGLTAALLLRDLELDVTVYERSPAELEQRGAGIGFLPASYRYLVERAGRSLKAISVATSHIRYLSRGGEVIHDLEHQYRFSAWNTVYRELLACFGRERYRLGHEMVSFEAQADHVAVSFADGSQNNVDLLVCADGVASRSRRHLAPDAHARYAGYVAWRGIVPEHSLDASTRKALGDAITYFVYAPRVQERCHPSHSYTRGLEDMTNARIQRGRQG